ncbi:O-antigen ligase [Chitinophaga arvensicola]|uniref:O-antigen ligase n=2 Tax=Chitinophaga arvensicola TaxID=29529 RepID=A0A1I0R8N5_9BACT|nr:O-antigen ligase [Chitinophaga arvensicola]
MTALLILLGAVFVLLPSAYSNAFYDPTQSAKFIFLAYSIAVVFLLLAGYTLFNSTPFRISISVLDLGLLLLLAYVAVNRYYLHTIHGFSLRWLELMALVITYIVLRRLSFRMYHYLLLAIIAGGLLQVLAGVLQLLGILDSRNAYFPVTGNFFNPGGYAGYLSLVAIVSFGLYIHRDTFSAKEGRITILLKKYLPLLALVGSIVLLPALRSRSAFFALAAGLGIVWLMYRYRDGRIAAALPFKRIATAAVLFIGLLYTFYLLKQNSADGRLLVYKVSATLIQTHPFTGVGMDRFKAHYMDAQARWFEQQGHEVDAAQLADNTFYAFNEPLQFVVENGWIGLLLVAAVVFFFGRYRSAESYMPVRTIAYGILLASLFFALFTYTSDNLAMKYMMVFALAILSGTESKVLFHIQYRRRVALVPVFFLLILFLVYEYGGVVNKVRESYAGWGLAQAAYVKGFYTESNRQFEAVYPLLHTNGEFLMQYGKSRAMAGNDKQALALLVAARQYLSSSVIETGIGDCEKKLGNYAAAEQAYRQAMDMIPNRFYPLYLLMTLYQESGEAEKAMTMARHIKIKKVKVPSKAISEIKGFADNLIKERNNKQ